REHECYDSAACHFVKSLCNLLNSR
ncbi:hypothetical protein CSUI_005620, partial [Cystoisospora suis]